MLIGAAIGAALTPKNRWKGAFIGGIVNHAVTIVGNAVKEASEAPKEDKK